MVGTAGVGSSVISVYDGDEIVEQFLKEKIYEKKNTFDIVNCNNIDNTYFVCFHFFNESVIERY